ncbi:MAG: hypothetical protein WA918_12100, partial [Erythrobacter sp.]
MTVIFRAHAALSLLAASFVPFHPAIAQEASEIVQVPQVPAVPAVPAPRALQGEEETPWLYENSNV